MFSYKMFFPHDDLHILLMREAAHERRRINGKKNKDVEQQKKVKEIFLSGEFLRLFFLLRRLSTMRFRAGI